MQQESENVSLVIRARDSANSEATATISIKLCVCKNNGSCNYNEFIRGSDNYKVKTCSGCLS